MGRISAGDRQALEAPVEVVAEDHLVRWRTIFIWAFIALFLIKLWVALCLAPFGDEAFYWQESRHLAWGYSDLPPMTAFLIRGGEAVAGHSLLGMRWPFLLLGSCLPWLVVWFGRSAFDALAGWQAGLLALLLPLSGSLGVLALPDVPLTVWIMLASIGLLRAMGGSGGMGWWCLVGVALGLAWSTHYRAAVALLAGFFLFCGTPRGRRQWRRGGLWLALLLAALGLVPVLVSNWQQAGAGLAFQLVQRNPWQFHADALVQPLEQAFSCSPLLYILLLWAAWHSWQRRDDGGPWDIVASMALIFLGGYFLLGLFADDLRFRAHWPLPGYLPLLAVLPVLLRERSAMRSPWGRVGLLSSLCVAALGLAGVLGYLGLAASASGADVLSDVKAFPVNFVGWQQVAAEARDLLTRQPQILVTDNFMLGAELDFQLDGRQPVYVLDSPLNVRHGREPQLRLWARDERSLRALGPGRPLLLIVEETGLRERARRDWLSSICGRVAALVPRGRLDLFDGRKRFAFYEAEIPAGPVPGTAAACPIWLAAYRAQYGDRAVKVRTPANFESR